MKRAVLLGLVFAFGSLSPAAETAPSIIVGKIGPQGEITFTVVEDFLIAGKSEIRLLDEQKGNVDPNQIKKLSKIKLSQAGVLRNDGTGRVVRPNENGTRAVVLPEDYALKLAAPAADVPGRLTLTLVTSKKSKQTDTLAPEQFYALLMGSPPDAEVLKFVSNLKAFSGGLDEQLRAMQGFVKSFPDIKSYPAVEQLRASLQRRMEVELADLEDGGKFDQLLLVQRYGKLARDAYPNDAKLKSQYENIIERRGFIEDKVALLQSLALAGEWDVLLKSYPDFERYQGSFPSIVALRQQAYEESARSHSHRALAYKLKEDHDTASVEATTAQQRDPSNTEIKKLLDAEKLLASQVAAGNAATKRKVLAKNSPEANRFDTASYNADRAIKDKIYARAETEISNMEHENADAPEIYLMRAQLLYAQAHLAEAIPRLDAYDRMVSASAELDKSKELRNQINYELGKNKEANKKEIDRLMKAKDYSQLNALLDSALKEDPNEQYYLYHGGLAAAVLRNNDLADKYLRGYLEKSDSKDGDAVLRDKAQRILHAMGGTKPAATAEGKLNWMSGRRLADGVYYDPETLAFQLPLDSILGMGGDVKKAFTWTQNRLDSIETTYEKEGKREYLKYLGGVSLDPAADDPGNFYFRYLPSGGPLMGVRTKGAKAPAAAKPFRVAVSANAGKIFVADDEGQPEIVFPSHPQVNVAVLNILDGVVSTIVAGNSFFNPFLWDSPHYFSVEYDLSGRAEAAQEWNADNRVTFTWDGQKLKEVQAFHKDSNTPYYRRTITYAPTGTNILSEEVTLNGKASGEVKYTYGTTGNKALQQIKVDGNDWVVKPH